MFAVHLLETSKPIDELVKFKVAGDACFVIIAAEYALVPRFVQYAFMQAYKTYASNTNTAKTLSLQWLCNLALTKNVSTAVNFTKPSGKEVCFACVNCFETEKELNKIGEKLKLKTEASLRKKAEQFLKQKYLITENALEVYPLEDLLIEKAAVENI